VYATLTSSADSRGSCHPLPLYGRNKRLYAIVLHQQHYQLCLGATRKEASQALGRWEDGSMHWKSDGGFVSHEEAWPLLVNIVIGDAACGVADLEAFRDIHRRASLCIVGPQHQRFAVRKESCSCSAMDHPLSSKDINIVDGSVKGGSSEGHPGYVCPLFKSDPIRHRARMGFKLARVSDVKQHLMRKHPEEAKRMTRTRSKKKTSKERWDALWDELFPDQTRLAMPYAGTQFVELVGAWVTEYIEQRREEVLSADGQTALMGYLAYIKVRSSGMGPGDVSGQGVTGISEHQTQGTRGPEHTHQHVPLSTNSFDPIMGSFEPADPRLVLAGHCVAPTFGDAPTFGAAIEPQDLSNLGAMGQYWAFPANSDAYPSAAPAHQPPPNPWMNFGLADENAGSLVPLFQPISALGGDWTANFHHDGRNASWDLSEASENAPKMLK